MERLEKIPASVLAAKVIASVDAGYVKKLGLKAHQRSIGIITADCDDVTYCALDEATKASDVEVVYTHSFYAGAGNSSGPTSGEVIGIIAGDSPADVIAGLDRCKDFITNEAAFCQGNMGQKTPFFAHLVSSAGSFLAKEAGVKKGDSLAYLIATPLEAVYALDAALKAADVELKKYYAPPSETNFAGGLLTGSQAACRAACDAFQEAILSVNIDPTNYH